MKFERISLEKYGAITAREVDFSNTAGLVIIYGPNEAGKSTLLCAIRDLLYGVPHTSPHGAIFGNNQMRIGAKLRLEDGSTIDLRRKKGRPPGDLVDGNDTPVPIGLMGTLLAGTNRDRFNALFGLDHVSLRDGGQKLLTSDGEIGRLIVEAGGGLRALVTTLAELEKEADELFSPKRSAKRRFYQALDAFQAAEKEVKQATTTREAFLKAQKAGEAASASLQSLRDEQKEAREAINRLSRIRRTAPQFQLLAQTEAALGEFADIERLVDELALEITKALAARDANLKSLADSERTVAGLQGELDKFVIANDIVAAAAEISAVESLAHHVEKARLDLPNRLADLAESKSQLAKLRGYLGLGDDEDLEKRAPSRAIMDDVQSLASEKIRLESASSSAKAQLAECQDNLLALRQKQVGRETKGFDKPAPVSAAELLRLPSLARDLDLKSKQIAGKQTSIHKDTEALGFDSSELPHRLWPSVAQIKSEIDHVAAIDTELRQASLAQKTATQRSRGAEKRISDLAAGAPPPTPAAVADARSERDNVWHEIRSYYLDAPDEGWSRPPQHQRSEEASNYDRLRSAADELVDRRGAEAQRLADIAAAEREKAEADIAVNIALQQIAELKQRLANNQRAWATSWPDANRIQGDLRRLLALTEKRDFLISQQRDLESQNNGIEQLNSDVESLTSLLDQVDAIHPSEHGESIAVRVERAVSVLEAHDDHYKDYRRDADELLKLSAREERLERQIAELEAKHAEWSASWGQTVSKLGLEEKATPQRAIEVATEWASAPGTFIAIRLTATRIKRMRADDEKLTEDINALRERLDVELPSDGVTAARQLKRLLEASTEKKLQRDALLPRFNQARIEFETATQRLTASDLAISELASKCNCDAAHLDALVPRIEARRDLRLKLASTRESIIAAGDGLSLDGLRDEWKQKDPDEISARLKELEGEVEHREKDIEAAISSKQNREAEIQAFTDDDRLNGLIAERENASAEMRQVIERYVEISLAQSLLNAAIERVRHEQQDPLLSRASELFSACTRGDFSGIETDVNNNGEPVVVGRRQGGETISLSEMSDGTRDQLFLSFRLASIEHYAENSEPIPFIADDVLVHFDDDRGQAALELLASVASKTQVLLFTHHEAVLEAASKLAAKGLASVVEFRE